MRIIGGKFKGKKLIEPKDKETRPLKDLTKESIFNIINHSNKFSIDLKKAQVLDLFSGVGSFGIECLSQGASHVTFVEKYEGVLPILKKNLNNLKSEINYEIIESDILNKFEFKSLKINYDIIFLDPPYKERALENILNKINESKKLNNNGIIIIHRHKKEIDIFPKNFHLIDEKKYGISKIIFGSYS
jgi:16S rRNA (guanine966-N2)-methyltransferase